MKKINNQNPNATRKQTLNLNEKCNEWLEKEMVNYVDGNPDNMDTILFDFNQFKKDTICMVDTLACQLQCKAHLQKTADVLCLGRITIHRIIKEKWLFLTIVSFWNSDLIFSHYLCTVIQKWVAVFLFEQNIVN